MNIINLVQSEIKKEFNKDVTPNTKISDLGIDSIDLLDFIVKIEEKYDIKINDDDLADIYYIKDIIKLLEKYFD